MAGYQMYIAKGDYWEDGTPRISLEEWKNLCESDPELRLETELKAINPATGEEITISGEAMCFWKDPVSGEEYLFEYRDGQITFSHEELVMSKAKEIARKLGSLIQGEEGEKY